MAFKHFPSCAASDPFLFKYVPVEEVERLEKYQPGGYHPILIGDVLRSRYRVVHKPLEATGPTQLLGPAETISLMNMWQSRLERRSQALESYAKGVVHGDIHIGNVLLRLPAGFDQLSIQQLYGKYGSAVSEPVVRFDGQPLESSVPSSVVLPIWLGKASEGFSLSESKVLLSDFGEAYRPSTERRCDSHAPLSFVPPEARFEPGQGLSFSSDIWSLACSIWIMLGQRPLFDDILATLDDITAEQVDTLGKLPLRWWDKWETRHQYFDERGEPNQGQHVRSWEDRFENHIQFPRQKAEIPGFSIEEKAALMDMLRLMLSFEPEKRLTAQEVLKCEWMETWALPDFEKSHSGATFTAR